MERISFSLLALQFYKYGGNLAQNGLLFNLQDNGNLFTDEIIVARQDSTKTYIWTANSTLWDRYRQFTLSMTGSTAASTFGRNTGFSGLNQFPGAGQKYHFRIPPDGGEPIRINGPNMTWIVSNELPHELQSFANEVLELIGELEQRYRNDKKQQDATELVV